MDIYENNLKALVKVDKALAEQLKSITENKLFEVFLAENEPLANIKIVDNRDDTAIDSLLTDVPNKLKEFEEYDNYHTLYFFGIGSGLFYKKLLKNSNHKKIYIFEPEIELIYIAFNIIDFSSEILEQRIIVKHSSEMNHYQIKFLIDTQSIRYLKKYNLDIYSVYYDKYMPEINRLNNAILLFLKSELQDKGDSLEDTLTGYKHSSKRMLEMFKYPSLSKVLKRLKNRKNAVMVATGPSLKKQLPLLKQYQDYFTILCVDASFPILSQYGIKPDVVLSMERDDAVTAGFYAKTDKKYHKDVVFMLATVCHNDTFNAVDTQSGILCPFLRADKHNITLGLDDWGYLGGGLSAANYMFTLAINSDFDNIVLIGQDLAYGKDKSSHSEGHILGADEIKFDDELFAGYIEAYGGHGEVATMKYWKIFLNDLVVQMAASKQYKKMQIYNATEGGARINGAIEIPFEKYCNTILDCSSIKESLNLSYPNEDEVNNVSLKYVKKQKELLQLAMSLNKQAKKTYGIIEKFLEKIIDESDGNVVNNIKDSEIDNIIKKVQEIRSKYEKPVFFNTYSTLFLSYLSHVDLDIAVIECMRENTSQSRKLKKLNFIKANYEWLFRLWASLEKIIEISEDSLVNPYKY